MNSNRKMKRYSFLKSAVHVQFLLLMLIKSFDKQYDTKHESSSHSSINVTQVYAVNNFIKRLAVERM